MIDYIAIILQGFTTGMGVIFAHEVWDVFKAYRQKAKQLLINEVKNND